MTGACLLSSNTSGSPSSIVDNILHGLKCLVVLIVFKVDSILTEYTSMELVVDVSTTNRGYTVRSRQLTGAQPNVSGNLLHLYHPYC